MVGKKIYKRVWLHRSILFKLLSIFNPNFMYGYILLQLLLISINYPAL